MLGIILSLRIICITTYSTYNYFRDEITGIELLYNIWELYCILGYTLSSVIFVINLIKYLDNTLLSYSNSLPIPIIFTFLLSLLTFFVYFKVSRIPISNTDPAPNYDNRAHNQEHNRKPVNNLPEFKAPLFLVNLGFIIEKIFINILSKSKLIRFKCKI